MKDNPKFIPGLKLSKIYFEKQIKPILNKNFPNLKYSAGLLGWGSEVLGYDTIQSRDHHWGPRLLIFLSNRDYIEFKDKISESLRKNLPYEFMGYSTNFSKPDIGGIRRSEKIAEGEVSHMIEIFTIKSFFQMRMGFDPYKEINDMDWLTFPQQRLLELTSGQIYSDGLNEINDIRKKFNFYPDDIWLYLLSCQWMKISREEAFVGRCGDVGDELGSKIIGTRTVKELMDLCFLMERKYYPYAKWFGTAFSELKCSKKLLPIFNKVLSSKTWKEREKNLSVAYENIVNIHNSLKITESLSAKVSDYYGRPYKVIFGDKIAKAIREKILNKEIKTIKNYIGSVDQFTDDADILEHPEVFRGLKIYNLK